MKENWIVPCNIKVYDVISHFKKNRTIIWKNAFTIHSGDIAYLYLGSPYGEIRYKCLVISDSVSDELLQRNTYAIPAKKSNNYFSKKDKYIQMELVNEYPAGTFKLSDLRNNGLGQVQIQARTDRRLQAYIDYVEKGLIKEEVITDA